MHRARVREYAIDDEALVFHPSTQLLYYLNETASFIWQISDGRTIHEAALLLTRRYEVDAGTALDNVREIVELLTVGGLLSQEAVDDARS